MTDTNHRLFPDTIGVPDAYPYGDFASQPSPNPLQYWYFPYYRDPGFWNNPIARVPKPG